MRARDQKGFAVTLELIVLLSVFGTVALFGMSTLDEYIVGKLGDFFGNKILIFDMTNGATGPPRFVGKAVGFNDYEAPYIVFRDQTASLDAPLAALLGVREGGFTSRMYVYYDDAFCSGNPYVLDPTDSAWGTIGHPVTDLYELQGTAYAVGVEGAGYSESNHGGGGVPPPDHQVDTATAPSSRQILYRSGAGAPTTIASYWISESYVTTANPAIVPAYYGGDFRFASLPTPGICYVGTIDKDTGLPNDLGYALGRFVAATKVGTRPLSDAVAAVAPMQTPFWIPVGKLQNATVGAGTFKIGSSTFGSFTPGTETTAATATSTDTGPAGAYSVPGTEGTDAKTLTVTPGKTTAPKKEGS